MYCFERIIHLRNPISYIWLIFSHICSNNKGILQIFHDFKENIKHFGTDSFQTKELVLNIQKKCSFFAESPIKNEKGLLFS
jgi:hypothetical protein